MRHFLTLVLLLAASLCPAAPAPLAKKARPQPDAAHPRWAHGKWTLIYYGEAYVYDFRPDGSYVHLRTGHQSDYSGLWRLDGRQLRVTEYLEGNRILEHQLVFGGGCWHPEGYSPEQNYTRLGR